MVKIVEGGVKVLHHPVNGHDIFVRRKYKLVDKIRIHWVNFDQA